MLIVNPDVGSVLQSTAISVLGIDATLERGIGAEVDRELAVTVDAR